jgi:hypothetical protein
VKRKCVKLAKSADGKRAIYIDNENREEILEYIKRDKRHKKKFQFITDIILGGYANRSLYDKEDISDKAKGVTAMKFFKGQENDRIYCKEIKPESGSHTYIVVAAILYEKKKTKKLNNEQRKIIEKVGGYQYEFEK